MLYLVFLHLSEQGSEVVEQRHASLILRLFEVAFPSEMKTVHEQRKT